jgi:hypothetical protein
MHPLARFFRLPATRLPAHCYAGLCVFVALSVLLLACHPGDAATAEPFGHLLVVLFLMAFLAASNPTSSTRTHRRLPTPRR